MFHKLTAGCMSLRRTESHYVSKLKTQKRAGENSGAITTTDTRPPITPKQFAEHLNFHEESVRRKLRNREWASIIVSRRRLIPATEVDRILREGFIARAA